VQPIWFSHSTISSKDKSLICTAAEGSSGSDDNDDLFLLLRLVFDLGDFGDPGEVGGEALLVATFLEEAGADPTKNSFPPQCLQSFLSCLIVPAPHWMQCLASLSFLARG